MLQLQSKLRSLANPEQAIILSKFFKTGVGQYGHGDRFLGIKVPVIRATIKEFFNLDLSQVEQVLHSEYHEERLSALLILVRKFQVSKGEEERTAIYELYLRNTSFINNWDLVDLSTPHIVGAFLYERDKSILYKLMKSSLIWDRRISILATFYFLRQKNFVHTFEIAQGLLGDKEDLIHKATGWMLREVGKREEVALEDFLRKHYRDMPRTMLRYAIEKFEEGKRQGYLKGLV